VASITAAVSAADHRVILIYNRSPMRAAGHARPR
jgi:hypothetical protein